MGKKYDPAKPPKVFAIKFNFMDFQYRTWYEDEDNNEVLDGQAKIMFGSVNFFGNYDIAEAMLKVEYSNISLNKRQKQ